jgi:histidinol-phosphate aminotransferase
VKRLLRPSLDGLAEYTLKQYPYRIKLNQNENPFELPAEIKREIVDRLAASAWSRYPAFVPQKQLDQLAAFTGWKPEGVLLGNGSNELLQLLFTCTLDASRSVVICEPTFTLYAILAQSLGSTVHRVPLKSDLTFDVDRIISTAKQERSAMVVLCSPNNPTGTQLPESDVIRILDETDALVAVDEAYIQFAPFSVVRLLDRYDRLVVLQTFSKAMGAAGLRFGYALMQPALATELNKVKLPYAVNIFTLMASEVLMERWDQINEWIATLITERERVRERLKAMTGITVYPSSANFLLFESAGRTPQEIFRGVLAKGILIRDVSSYPMLGRALRVSIGTPEENNEFLTALEECL